MVRGQALVDIKYCDTGARTDRSVKEKKTFK